MKNTPENIVKRQVRRYLEIRGWFNFPLTAGLGCYPGVCDRIAVKNGRVLFIEVKSPAGNQSLLQKRFQACIEASGGIYILARSVEDLARIVEEKK
jgi:Holliday junction resolvase